MKRTILLNNKKRKMYEEEKKNFRVKSTWFAFVNEFEKEKEKRFVERNFSLTNRKSPFSG